MISKILYFLVAVTLIQSAKAQTCTRNSQCLNQFENYNAVTWSAAPYTAINIDTARTAWNTVKVGPGSRYRFALPPLAVGGSSVIEITACSNSTLELGYHTGYGLQVTSQWYQDRNNYTGCSGNFGTTGEWAQTLLYTTYTSYIYVSGDSATNVTDSVELRYRLLWAYPSPNAYTGYDANTHWLGTVYNGLSPYTYAYNGNWMGAYGTETANFTHDFSTGQPGGYSVPMCLDTSTCLDNDTFQVVYTKNVYPVTSTYIRASTTTTGSNGTLLSLWLGNPAPETLTEGQTGNTFYYSTSYGSNWTAVFRKKTGSFVPNINICNMNGTITSAAGKFNSYVYNKNTTSLPNVTSIPSTSVDAYYQGTFSTDSLGFAYSWGSTHTPQTDSLLQGERCGRTMTDTYYGMQMLGRDVHAKGQQKFRVRVTGTGLLTFSYLPQGGSTFTTLINNTSGDITTSAVNFSTDTVLYKLVYTKTTGNVVFSFNHAVQPKNTGTMHATHDTVCLGNTVTLSVDTTEFKTEWYRNVCGTGVYVGSGATITVTPDSTSTYYARNRNRSVLANDTANVLDLISASCASKRIIVMPNPAAPTAPTAQSTCSDTAYTFMFDSIIAGAGGNQIEWATNSSFTSSTIASSPATINVTVDASETDTVWIRSRVSATGCVSASTIAIAINNLNPAPPNITGLRTVCIDDTSYTFIFTGINPGSGGNQVEWATNSNFIGSTIINNSDSIFHIVLTGDQDTIWMRSIDTTTGCVSLAETTIMVVIEKYCGIGNSSYCTPSGSFTGPGLSNYQNLPCVVRNSFYSEPIAFKNFDTIYAYNLPIRVDSLRIDSIGNLPCGLCWATNKPGNTFAANESGCILINGISSDNTGAYWLDIFVTNFTSGGMDSFIHADKLGLRYWIRVIDSGQYCQAVDTVSFSRIACEPLECILPTPELVEVGTHPACNDSLFVLSYTTTEPYNSYGWYNLNTFTFSDSSIFTDTFPLSLILIVRDTLSSCGNAIYKYIGTSGIVPELYICYVTVDTSSDENLIVWDNGYDISNVDSILVYRLDDIDSNEIIVGSVSVEDPALFLDIGADPDLKAYSYQLGVLDTCGIIHPALGYDFTTMHLEVDSDVNGFARLNWTIYEGANLTEINILRRLPGGSWGIVARVNDNTNTYIDANILYGIYEYCVEMPLRNSCTPSRSASENTTRSNSAGIKKYTPLQDMIGISKDYVLYPNPTYDILTLSALPDKIPKLTVTVFDLLGHQAKLIAIKETSSSMVFDISNLTPAIYFILVDDGLYKKVHKIIKY